jgi:hypothetical protein
MSAVDSEASDDVELLLIFVVLVNKAVLDMCTIEE